MKSLKRAWLPALLLAMLAAVLWQTWPEQKPMTILAYTVTVHPEPDKAGSGTVIGNAKYYISGKPVTFSLILTCQHVVDDVKEVKVTYRGVEYPATVVAVDTDLDLALLEVKEHWPAAPLHLGKVSEGEDEIAAGSPLDTHVVLNRGYVGPIDTISNEFKHVTRQGTAAIWPGNSGGGVWVYRAGWKLAGVAEAIHSANMASGGMHGGREGQFGFMMQPPQLASNVSYSITMDDVQAFLRKAGYN